MGWADRFRRNTPPAVHSVADAVKAEDFAFREMMDEGPTTVSLGANEPCWAIIADLPNDRAVLLLTVHQGSEGWAQYWARELSAVLKVDQVVYRRLRSCDHKASPEGPDMAVVRMASLDAPSAPEGTKS